MFNKLSYAEKSQLFAGLSVLESKYGKVNTETAIKKMVETLESPQKEKVEPVKVKEVEQITLFTERRKRPVSKKQAQVISRNLGYESLNICLVDLYYGKNLKQKDIADKFNCGQRTVSGWLNDIPETEFNELLKDVLKRKKN